MTNINQNEFNVGDIVVKRYGSKPFRITDKYGRQVAGRYLHNNNMAYADFGSFVHYEGDTSNSPVSKKTLYSFMDESGDLAYGLHVGTNSQDLYILEVEGRGDYVVKDPREIEEVLPYTFSVKLNSREVHYIGEPGRVSKGDWLILDSKGSYNIAQVQSVDTKNKGAKSKFSGRRIITEEL